MNRLRTIISMTLCVLLFAGNVANAAMPCCCVGDTSMKMTQGDMPCHTDDESSDAAELMCSHCDCLHSSVPGVTVHSQSSVILKEMKESFVAYYAGHVSSSHYLIFQPPKA